MLQKRLVEDIRPLWRRNEKYSNVRERYKSLPENEKQWKMKFSLENVIIKKSCYKMLINALIQFSDVCKRLFLRRLSWCFSLF